MSLTPILTNLLQLFWHQWKIYQWHCIVDTGSKFTDGVTATIEETGKDVTTSVSDSADKFAAGVNNRSGDAVNSFKMTIKELFGAWGKMINKIKTK